MTAMLILLAGLISVWGEAVIFSVPVEGISPAGRVLGRIAHLLNAGSGLIVVYTLLLLLSRVISAHDASLLVESLSVELDVLFAFIGVVCFSVNVAFYQEFSPHDPTR